jgi:choline dehydrogenase-like flavoprotein
MIHKVIIVGTGPSGVAAALGFAENGIQPMILDVGKEAHDAAPVDENFYDYRKKNDALDVMIGKNYETLSHVINKRTPSPKISSPHMQFVTKDAERLSPIKETGSHIIQSFAKGGLASAWGAGLYMFRDDELINMPVNTEELAPFYDQLTREIGISGDNDDLTPFFGSAENLLTPLKLSAKSEKLYARYKRKRRKLNAEGIFMGRPRLGVLSQDHDNRISYNYRNLEMWFPDLPYIYTPAFTLDKLIKNKKALYNKSILVESWSKENNYLAVKAKKLDDGSKLVFKCKKLVLAAGAISSAKIALKSKNDYETKLPLLDNSLLQVPLITPSFIGDKLEKDSFGLTNLNIIFDWPEYNLRLQGSIIELTSPSRALFYEMLPLSAKSNLALIKYLLPSVSVLFLYFPGSAINSGYIMLRPDNSLEVESSPCQVNRKIIRRITQTFLRMGVVTHPLLVKLPAHSIHYAGSMPMVNNPDKPYCCNRYGELYQEPGVYVVDGSLLSYIPSKNHSFTLMANAMRIADYISRTMEKQ